MNKKQTQLTITDVVKQIKRIAYLLSKEPQELRLRELVDNALSERQVKRFGGLTAIKKAYFPQTDKELADIKELKNQSKYVTQLENQLAATDLFERKIVEALSKTKAIKITPFKAKKKAPIKRAINLVLSDLHFGSDITKEETGKLAFGKIEESRRIARITREVLEYKPQYRAETELNVLILGDIIENKLHDLGDDSAPIAEQAARAIYLLTQSLAHMIANFPKINVHFATGNHGRNTGRHHGRAVSQKWDSIETIVYYALKNTFREHKNVSFNIPLTPFAEYSVFGKRVFVTHGDTVLNVGYPGSAIKTGSLEHQINRINASLPDKEEYAVFIVGHVHVGSVTHLSNGATLITNGAMVPSNAFAVSIGLMEAACGQYLFESVPGYPVGDCRYIRVGLEDDQNAELDNLVKPWEKL